MILAYKILIGIGGAAAYIWYYRWISQLNHNLDLFLAYQAIDARPPIDERKIIKVKTFKELNEVMKRDDLEGYTIEAEPRIPGEPVTYSKEPIKLKKEEKKT